MEEPIPQKKLYRSTRDSSICGVLGGLAEYLSVDPALMRALFLLSLFLTAFLPLALAYFAAGFIMPLPPDGFKPPELKRRFFRSTDDRKLLGIIGGLAEYFKLDPTLLRLAFIFALCLTAIAPGIIGYFAAYFVAPDNPAPQA
ncbi:MAG: PspC domain-containing protein [Elusimicrobiaceae bacterium]|nr:PspC domain-containing protein [Elusimicrobiaceae bacterium]